MIYWRYNSEWNKIESLVRVYIVNSFFCIQNTKNDTSNCIQFLYYARKAKIAM